MNANLYALFASHVADPTASHWRIKQLSNFAR
jgi:hypothetical protein